MVTNKTGSKAQVNEKALKIALNYQWKEFTSYLQPGVEKDQVEFSKLMNQLNSFIENETFFSGGEIAECDHILFESLHPFYAQMSFAQKQKYVSLSRWFDHIQHLRTKTSEKRASKEIVISVNNLY